jgi:hypothetical protein
MPFKLLDNQLIMSHLLEQMTWFVAVVDAAWQ